MIIEMNFSNFYTAHEAVDCPSLATINLRHVLHSVGSIKYIIPQNTQTKVYSWETNNKK